MRPVQGFASKAVHREYVGGRRDRGLGGTAQEDAARQCAGRHQADDSISGGGVEWMALAGHGTATDAQRPAVSVARWAGEADGPRLREGC